VRTAWPAALAGCLALAACTSGGAAPADPPTGAPAACRTDVLAGWRTAGLAVLWVPRPETGPDPRAALPAAVAAVDVRNGETRSYCPLPAAAPVVQRPLSVPMRQGGTAYPDVFADLDLMLRTQWLSADFRWFGAPGLPLVDVAAGRALDVALPGTLAGVGADYALVRTGIGWCTVPLPAGGACAALLAGAGAGGYLVGASGRPVWVRADAVSLPFGAADGYGVTDGTRVYRADTEPAATRRAAVPAGLAGPFGAAVDLDPAGLGGFQAAIDAQPRYDPAGWFSVVPGAGGTVSAVYHHTAARREVYGWLLGDAAQVSRALADGGRTAVTAAPAVDGNRRVTRFGALVDGSTEVLDLSAGQGVHCPVPASYCRILAWPDGTTDRA
jgi:hypothetical protein